MPQAIGASSDTSQRTLLAADQRETAAIIPSGPQQATCSEPARPARAAGEFPDTIFLLEHEPVYTIGRKRDRSSLGHEPLPHPVEEINRGGQATFHGPGQLVGYFIFDLQKLTPDLHAFLRWIEAEHHFDSKPVY